MESGDVGRCLRRQAEKRLHGVVFARLTRGRQDCGELTNQKEDSIIRTLSSRNPRVHGLLRANPRPRWLT